MLAVLGCRGDVVNRARFDRAGKRVVTEERWLGKEGVCGRARVWSLDGEQMLEVVTPGKRPLVYAGFSPDGRLLATVSNDGRLYLWHTDHGDLLFDIEANIKYLDDDMFSPDGNKMVLPTKGRVMIYDGISALGSEKARADQGSEEEDAGVGGKDVE